MEREQLDDALRQQQADTRSQLDLKNEKMESWVSQCFSDLNNRIVELYEQCLHELADEYHLVYLTKPDGLSAVLSILQKLLHSLVQELGQTE